MSIRSAELVPHCAWQGPRVNRAVDAQITRPAVQPVQVLTPTKRLTSHRRIVSNRPSPYRSDGQKWKPWLWAAGMKRPWKKTIILERARNARSCMGMVCLKTIRLWQGNPFQWRQHLDRLAAGPHSWGLNCPIKDTRRWQAYCGTNSAHRDGRRPLAHHGLARGGDVVVIHRRGLVYTLIPLRPSEQWAYKVADASPLPCI